MTRATPSTSTTATCHRQPRHPVRAFRLATCAHGLSLDIEIEESRPSYTIDSLLQRSCSPSTLVGPPCLTDFARHGSERAALRYNSRLRRTSSCDGSSFLSCCCPRLPRKLLPTPPLSNSKFFGKNWKRRLLRWITIWTA